ncbi:MAG TPA: chemotaxis protein CheW [Anaerolineae bacterium]|nr:chemotaxis protein CheW [Anaerolineae bacterium]
MNEKIVVFRLAAEKYGVDVKYVQSIIEMQTIVTVPHAPDFVSGVINLRGAVIPVIDLGIRFELTREAPLKQVIVIVEFGQLQIGLIVDKVMEVLTADISLLEPPSPLLVTVNTTYLRGILRDDEELIILLDLARVFSLEEQTALQIVAE